MRIIISLHIQPKIPQKSHVSTIFLAKTWVLLIFMYILNASKFPSALWLNDVQWRHMKFNGTHFGINE